MANLTIASAERGNLTVAQDAVHEARRLAGSSEDLLRIADLANAQVLLRRLDVATAEAVLEHVVQRAPVSDPIRGHALISLATARFNRGRMAEAVEAATEAVEAYRQSLGDRHPGYGRALHTLGTSLAELGDPAAARDALAQASSVLSAAFGPAAVQVQSTEIERAAVDLRLGDLAAAEAKAERALSAFTSTPPPDARPVGLALVLRGLIAETADRREAAATFYEQAQIRIAEARGELSPDLGFSLVRLGRLLTRMARYQDAAAALERALIICEAAGSAGTVRVADVLSARAELWRQSGNRRGALDDAKRALALLQERVSASDQVGGSTASAQRRGAREIYAALAHSLVALRDEDPRALQDGFVASQEALSSRAGDAMRRAALRRATTNDVLGRLLAEREEAIEAVQQADNVLLASAAARSPIPAEEADRLRYARADAAARVRTLSAEMLAVSPQFAGYIQPRPVEIRQVQEIVVDDEALIFFVVTEGETLIWGIRRNAAEAISVTVGSTEIANLVRRIRLGVDLGLEARGVPLEPFDVIAARALHDLLLLPIERIGVLDGVEHVIVIPDGALQSLPLHLLLDARQKWLIQRLAFTTAPSIGAFLASRDARRTPSQATMAFLGVGDPHFAGFARTANVRHRGANQRLWSELAQLPRLPDAAEEVRRIARILGERESIVLVGDDATERAFVESDPRRFQVISLSTHALMAGELPGLNEPVVVLTPVEDDAPLDGLLTGSDIALLALDADLVLLSACNTAAPDGGAYAEGLSGLARAFLQAGARELLVSHWSVASDATTRLMTDFARIAAMDPTARRTYALQGAIHRMLNDEDPRFRHPAVWAPFVIVGG
ncbi:CHAT domain-containing protein [Neoroseomonas rubea]|uniref:CHAT domain-containing protein n=1 Tax=Neoroseomonas rubea TaxID=2748666 RepID=UPI0018DF0E4A|nr:CHAT domain-containing tetratricopeptide repeat protein [Roseomonas rubea]